MTETGLVTAVVPHYGDPAPTRALVGELHAQRGVRLEVVVVDDASPEPFPATDGVRLARRERNGGFGSAVNTGAQLATGDLLLVLNSDVTIDPGFVTALVTAAEPFQPCVAGPSVRDRAGHRASSGRRFPTAVHQVAEWLTPLARFRATTRWQAAVGHDTSCRPGTVTPVDWLVGAALLVPLAHFRAVGGFDETFFMNCEEVDLQRRLRARGLPSVFLGTVGLVHTGGGSSDPLASRGWLVAARLRYAAKWGGRRRLAAALTAATMVNLAANTARRLRRARVAPLRTARAELALIRGRPR